MERKSSTLRSMLERTTNVVLELENPIVFNNEADTPMRLAMAIMVDQTD